MSYRPFAVLAGLFVLAVTRSAHAAPPNDTCAGAIPLTVGSYAVTTIGATTEAGPTSCVPTTNDIWYSYAAAADGTLTVDTCASASFDTVLLIYPNNCPTLAPILSCSDDACAAAASRASAQVRAGQTYLIRLGGFNGASGNATLTVSFTPLSASAFTYQGSLQSSGTPYTGTADIRFRLFNAASGGTQIGSDRVIAGVAVNKGLFTCTLDFDVPPTVASGTWLDIAVASPSGSGPLTAISPRTLLTSAPFANVANRLGGVLSVNGASIVSTGTITAPNFQYTTPVSSVISIPSSAFQANNGDAVRFDLTGATTVSTTSSAALAAPVSIPSGATITNVTFLYTDNSATDIVFTLSGENDLGAEQLGASGTTSGASAGLRTLSVAASYVANNPQYRYSIRALPTGNWSAALRVAGARITYTLPQPVP